MCFSISNFSTSDGMRYSRSSLSRNRSIFNTTVAFVIAHPEHNPILKQTSGILGLFQFIIKRLKPVADYVITPATNSTLHSCAAVFPLFCISHVPARNYFARPLNGQDRSARSSLFIKRRRIARTLAMPSKICDEAAPY